MGKKRRLPLWLCFFVVVIAAALLTSRCLNCGKNTPSGQNHTTSKNKQSEITKGEALNIAKREAVSQGCSLTEGHYESQVSRLADGYSVTFTFVPYQPGGHVVIHVSFDRSVVEFFLGA